MPCNVREKTLAQPGYIPHHVQGTSDSEAWQALPVTEELANGTQSALRFTDSQDRGETPKQLLKTMPLIHQERQLLPGTGSAPASLFHQELS